MDGLRALRLVRPAAWQHVTMSVDDRRADCDRSVRACARVRCTWFFCTPPFVVVDNMGTPRRVCDRARAARATLLRQRCAHAHIIVRSTDVHADVTSQVCRQHHLASLFTAARKSGGHDRARGLCARCCTPEARCGTLANRFPFLPSTVEIIPTPNSPPSTVLFRDYYASSPFMT